MSKETRHKPIRVIYVLGAARSGSTVLNTVLGHHNEIEGVGELGYLSRSGNVFEERCACGEWVEECPYWREVRRVWAQHGGPRDVAQYIELQRKFESGRWRPRPVEHRDFSDGYGVYVSQVQKLFEAIRRVSGKDVIADTTKTPWRALALSRIPGLDLRIVHLIRDARGVAWAMKKGLRKDDRGGVQRDQPPRAVSRSAAYWVAINLQAFWVCHQVRPKRSIRVRYEDLIADPKETLTRIGTLVDCDLTELSDASEANATFPVGHIIAGNRLRMAGAVRLQLDKEWTKEMPVRDRILCWAIAGWLLTPLGYSVTAGGYS
jgi:hypothetical protein